MSQQNQMQRRPNEQLATGGSFTTAHAATEALRKAQEIYNLVSPASSVAEIPEGCAVVLSQVLVDLSTGQKDNKTVYTSGDVYPTDGGKFGLSKAPLFKIAAALGVSWVHSARVDNGRNPLYVQWTVVGVYKSFDGQILQIRGNKQMDLREGSKQIDGKSPNQVKQMRQFILEHAESKAKLRAIGDLVQRSYTLEQLKKPFVVAKMAFNGRTNDPRLKELFAGKIADAYLGGTTALYGGGHAQVPQLMGPPPVGSVDDDDDGYDYDTGEVLDTAGEQVSQKPASSAQPRQPQGEASGFKIPGGNAKGTLLENAADRDLAYWHNRIGKDLNEGTSRDADRDRDLWDALGAEINRRAGGKGEQQELGGKL